jgi:hypothetical protein
MKVRLEDSERTRDTLSTHNICLQDRASNYEQSQEANSRQVQRKDRIIEELRENISREKRRVSSAERTAKEAATQEEEWRNEANQMRCFASQKEVEYSTIVACRNLENERHGGSLKQLRDEFEQLLRQRFQDEKNYDRLRLIAEQQSQTIAQLQDLNSKTNTNFTAYRTEVDEVISQLKNNAQSSEVLTSSKVEEMTQVTSRMKWLMAVDRDVNHSTAAGNERTTMT